MDTMRKDQPIAKWKAGPQDNLEDGEFTAYASVFDVVDSYHEIVVKGAFEKTLEAWKSEGKTIPLLYGHNLSDPDYFVGEIVDAEEDDNGLLVRGRFDLEMPKAKQVYRLVKGRRLNELSFGFRINESEIVTRDSEKYLELREIDLIEVSLVPVGANPATEVVSIKAGRKVSAETRAKLKNAAESISAASKVIAELLDQTEADANPETSDASSDKSPDEDPGPRGEDQRLALLAKLHELKGEQCPTS